MKKCISVVVPVYNSQNTLEELASRIINAINAMDINIELIFVDDCSKDESFSIMMRIYDSFPKTKIIRLQSNYGQQNALLCGIRHAQGDYIITMDDDLQHPPEEIPKLMNKIMEGFDVVYGIPKEKMHRKYRNFGSMLTDRLFNIICRKPSGARVSSFRVMTSDIAKKVQKCSKSFVYISAITLEHTKNIGNVTVMHNRRAISRSNYNFIKLFKLFIKLALYYSCAGNMKLLNRKPQYIISDVKP